MALKIAISMIMLDDHKYIKRAITSCSFADLIVAVDGGSTDGTVPLCVKAANEIRVDCHIEEVPWRKHFAQQRQAALRMVPPEIDWWIRIDSDEVYPPPFIDNIRGMLELVPDDCQCVRIRQNNLIIDESLYSAARGGWETWPRIFRNIRLEDGSPAWNWVDQVHEHCSLMTKKGLIDPDPLIFNLSVTHHGWLDQERRESRESLYSTMPGSGFEAGSLTQRTHIVKEMPR
jgi:glycosyltransferase involved in cell wall biosynthesis